MSSFITALVLLISTDTLAEQQAVRESASARRIEKVASVPASRKDVWRALTTTSGARSFFAPDARVDLRAGGAYEMYFDDSQPEGRRGSEGCRIVSFEKERSLLFTWNAPPRFGPLRDEHTWVLIELMEGAHGATTVKLTHFGWREGEAWNEIYRYFDRAWDHVLQALKRRFHGHR